jgi:gliding motility-associated-like protein
LPTVLQLPQTGVAISNLTPFRENWSYTWDFGDASGSNSGDAVLNHDYAALMSDLSSLVITVKLTATSPQGCSRDTSVQVTILPVPPEVAFEPDTQGCQPLPVVFRNNSKYGSFYEWTFGDGTTSNEQNPVHMYQNPGLYSVTLKVTGPGGSTSIRRDNIINVFRTPSAEFSPDETVVITIPNDPYKVRGSVPPAGENWNYDWDFGDGGTGSGQSVSYFYKEIGEYNVTLTVTSDNGCVNTKTLPSGVRTKLGGAIAVPNAFIPGNIPMNDFTVSEKNRRTDVFYPFSEGVREIEMQIFNRWGELIFFSTQVGKGWNGWQDDRQCKSDVYVYKIKATFSDGRQETRVGDVTLIR